MKNIIIACFSLSIVASLSATEVVSAPVGFLQLTFPASTASTLSLPLQKNPVAVGPITSVGTTTLSSANASWISGQFSAASNPYFVKIVSGAAAGRYFLITANTANQLTVEPRGTALSATIVAGDRYQIIPARTLGLLFGTSTVPFLTNTDPTLADNIKLWSGSAWEIYYHNGTSWLRKGNTAIKNDVVIYPDEGIVVVRRGTTPLTLAFAGEASVIAERTEVIGPATTFAANRYPVNTTLSNLGLLNLPNWLSGATASDADRVQIRQGGSWITYWYTGTQWKRGGTSAVQDNTSIAAGAGYLILRRSSSTGLNDFASQPLTY
jgi:uncharacterized protein (TIGR02597 family)